MNRTLYPLRAIDITDLKSLCEVLWGWNLCANCRSSQPCNDSGCDWRRSTRLTNYFAFYKNVTSAYVPDLCGNHPALSSHQDIIRLVQLIKNQPNDVRSQLTHCYFSQRVSNPTDASHPQSINKTPSPADQQRAFNLAVKVMSMISCSAEKLSLAVLDLEIQQDPCHLPWHDNTTFSTFVEMRIPKIGARSMSGVMTAGLSRSFESVITAHRLEKLARLTFRGTADLGNHLRLDLSQGVVEIYHYTSVLKEHLLAARSSSKENIPSQIAVEVLHSLQVVLFPFGTDSESTLRRLIAKESLDPDCVIYDFADYDDNFTYHYFGSRLTRLCDEIDSPSPRGLMEKWFERKSGARYIMMATLVGVMLAVVLGVLSLAVGLFQSWVAYEAWRHPVTT